MSLTYRNNITGSTVEAVRYLEDATNAAFVRDFLDERRKSPWGPRHTALGGPRYETICFYHIPGQVLYINPGEIIYLTESGHWYTTSDSDFHANFTEIIEAPVPEDPTVYTKISDPRVSVRAMQWVKGVNDKEFCNFVIAQTSGKCYPDSTGYDGKLYFYPDFDAVGVFNAQGKAYLPIHPDSFFVVRPRTGETPLVLQYSAPIFHANFTQITTTPKEAPMPTPEQPTEYQTHREEVLDALAVLRSNPTDHSFTLATTEIMDLLAAAYNTGWDAGLEAGQTNPYVDWA